MKRKQERNTPHMQTAHWAHWYAKEAISEGRGEARQITVSLEGERERGEGEFDIHLYAASPARTNEKNHFAVPISVYSYEVRGSGHIVLNELYLTRPGYRERWVFDVVHTPEEAKTKMIKRIKREGKNLTRALRKELCSSKHYTVRYRNRLGKKIEE